jgi:phosphoribosylformimino-5-aminoimidazole carboxamide ribotide isomerase
MYIIPAIDILDKKVVRLREGDYKQVTSYEVSLEEMIEKYQSYGTNMIHIIDLNGAKNDFSNQQYLFDVIKKTDMKVPRPLPTHPSFRNSAKKFAVAINVQTR